MDNGIQIVDIFFVWELLFEPETEEQEYFVKNMELPGRLYSKVVKFNYV
jgi:hypothetical protein